MTKRILIVDGMLSGTGIRDAVAGGYVDPDKVGLSAILLGRLAKWLLDYENAHYLQFADKAENERLDQEGVGIARQIQEELPEVQIDYFSNAEMHRLAITSLAGEGGTTS
jgi:hypothetical protein